MNSRTNSGNSLSAAVLQSPLKVTVTNPTDGSTGLILNWDASTSSGIDGYKVYRSATKGGSYAEIATVNGRNNTTYQDTVAPQGANYYQVRAYRNSWVSGTAPADEGSVALPAASGLTWSTNTSAPTQIRYQWNAVPGAVEYRFQYKACITTDCAPTTTVVSTTNTSYTIDENLVGRWYYWSVLAVDARGTVGAQANGEVSYTIPSFPANSSLAVNYGNYFGDFEGYTFSHGSTSRSVEVQRRMDGGVWSTVNSALQNWGGVEWTGSAAVPVGGHNYEFRVRGCNNSGCTAWWAAPGVNRVPYNYEVRRSMNLDTASGVTKMFHRMAGVADDYTFVYYQTGGQTASNFFDHTACPAFRSCTGTDKSTLVKNPTATNGYVGRTGNFTPTNHNASTPRTWEFSYRQSGTWRSNAALMWQPATAGFARNRGWLLHTGTTQGRLTWGTNQTFPQTLNYADGQWHQYQVTYNGTNIVTLYEDGVNKGSITLASPISTAGTSDSVLGSGNESTLNITRGAIGWYDEWAMYARALTPTEVSEHWAARADGN